jgi:hypothetical protein
MPVVAWVSAGDARTGIAADSVSPVETAALARLASVEAVANIGARAFVRPNGARRVEWRGLSGPITGGPQGPLGHDRPAAARSRMIRTSLPNKALHRTAAGAILSGRR